MKRMIMILVATALLGSIVIAESRENSRDEGGVPASVPAVHALNLEYRAMANLYDFLTREQKKVRGRLDLLIAYLESINKFQKFKSTATMVDIQEEWPFEKVVASAIQYQKDNPDSVHAIGEDEARRDLGKKVVHLKSQAGIAYAVLITLKQTQTNLGVYLRKIGKLDDYEKWAELQVQKAAEAHAAELIKLQMEPKDDRKRKVAIQKLKHAAKAERNCERRDELMRLRCQYDMLRERDNTMVNVARCGGFGRNTWWRDDYHDVPGSHHPYWIRNGKLLGGQQVHVRDRDGNAIASAKISVIARGKGDTGVAAWTDIRGDALLPRDDGEKKIEYLEIKKEGYLTRRIRRPANSEKAIVELSKSRRR